MSRKRIGVIIAQTEENTQNLFMQGFLTEAFDMDYDVCIFSMYQKYQETPLRERGDSNIYNLIQYDLFDAFVVLLDTLQTPGVNEMVQERLHDYFDGPVLVVDKESQLFPNVMIDHCTPLTKLVDHLIDVHGYKDIVFLNGKPEHIHSIQRLQGYKNSLMNHGMPVLEEKIFNGTYWYDSGDPMVDQLMKDPEHLPDAIVCANDCMAIGVSVAFTRYGVRIPEDIAIIGYDSIEDGRMSPVPITSADIPAKECGTYAAQWVHATLNGVEPPEFHVNPPLFIGGSCGCPYHAPSIPHKLRVNWETELSTTSYYSCFNHIMEDLLSQTDYRSFFNTVFQYTYQIKGFDSYHLCLNECWDNPQSNIGEDALRFGYTNNTYRILKCVSEDPNANVLSFDDVFETSQLLPDLTEERDKPCAYIFTPLHFDDRCFGYAVVSYGNQPRVYDDLYRVWTRSIMQGMEAFNRQDALRRLLNTIEATQIRDTLTGLYNYKGFLAQSEELCEAALFEDKFILITAIDLNKIREINATFGRNEGDRAIIALSQIVSECTNPNELCCRMCNDEFLMISVVDKNDKSRAQEIQKLLEEKCALYNESYTTTFQIEACIGSASNVITGSEELEHLINEAVSKKNLLKAEANKKEAEQAKLSPEKLAMDELVKDILDNNRFIYHFQPIVNARTGSIYAYEALMRANTKERVSPPDILESAERLDRLYDVEKATFFNVLDFIESHEDVFSGKKVFINSIPGYQLVDEDKKELEARMKKHAGNLVVEFTEETQINDQQLAELKANYKSMNIETAIDDYGSGYSNVNNLLRYMPRYVKIDRMLLNNIQDNPQKQHFVKDIIEFAHDNDIVALAEGVETTKELKEVIRLGTDLIQGYYTARPQAEAITRIEERLENEIVQFSQANNQNGNKQHIIKDSTHVSLVSLALNKVSEIVIDGSCPTGSTIHIVGASGFQSQIRISIRNEFHGTVSFDNASIIGQKGHPCVTIGENCNVTLLLNNDNELHTGGIQVPASSRLTLMGDGNLRIVSVSGKSYGIGNTENQKHGDLIFEQDGCIQIETCGIKGIGIGSDLGGNIDIRKGSYDITINGHKGVGIGAYNGASSPVICDCDMEFHFDVAQGVTIGSLYSDADIQIRHTSGRFICGGTEQIGIGCYDGENCRVAIDNSNLTFDMRANASSSIGSLHASTDIHVAYASVKTYAEGRLAYAFGNQTRTAHICCENANIINHIKNIADSDMGAIEENIRIANGRSQFFLNDEPVERTIYSTSL